MENKNEPIYDFLLNEPSSSLRYGFNTLYWCADYEKWTVERDVSTESILLYRGISFDNAFKIFKEGKVRC